ncbi:hypothetical protein MIR68_000595 [Amoeboaphelidium protococcarum]|nr:hypothetical protein MIR68_000595 [Amoeboaphelidium protococcarum]
MATRTKVAQEISRLNIAASNSLARSDNAGVLRILALPIAFKLNPVQKIDQCFYMLYPMPARHRSTSMMQYGTMKMVNVWRNGLWIIGRTYKTIWDFMMRPRQQMKSIGHNEHQSQLADRSKDNLQVQSASSFIDKLRLPVYRWSQSLIRQWSLTMGEDFMRHVDLTSGFIHLKRDKLQMPVKKIELIYPRFMDDMKCSSDYLPQQQLASKSEQIDVQLQDTVNHVQTLEQYMVQQRKRAAKVLLITLPFYAVFPYTLYEIDAMQLLSVSLSGFDKIVSLPIAYNFIKLFSYHRCLQTVRLFNTINDTEQKVAEQCRNDIEQCRQKLTQDASTMSDGQRLVLESEIKSSEEIIDSHGFHIHSDSDLNQSYRSTLSQPCAGSSKQQQMGGLVWIDKAAVARISQLYSLDAAQLYKYVVKASEKTRLNLEQ